MTILDQLIPLADAHQQADEYVSGTYWEQLNGHGRGCAVGCTIHDAVAIGVLPAGTQHDNHADIAEATGIPEMLWRLADHIFEELSDADRPGWTPRFLRAASQCKCCDRVPARVMGRLARRLADDAIRDDVRDSATLVASLWERRGRGDDPAESEWDAAWKQAYAAWKQAYAARKQAYAARKQAHAAWKQADAAREQAYAAWKQAHAAWEQADAAREQAYAAREQFWQWCADVVCEELAA